MARSGGNNVVLEIIIVSFAAELPDVVFLSHDLRVNISNGW